MMRRPAVVWLPYRSGEQVGLLRGSARPKACASAGESSSVPAGITEKNGSLAAFQAPLIGEPL